MYQILILIGGRLSVTVADAALLSFVCREIFLEFDPRAVSKLSEKKIAAPGSPASSLLSELKIRGIIENARQICKAGTYFHYLLLISIFILQSKMQTL